MFLDYYSQFDKHPYGDAVVHGQQFDINSVMMYSKYVEHVLFKGNIKNKNSNNK